MNIKDIPNRDLVFMAKHYKDTLNNTVSDSVVSKICEKLWCEYLSTDVVTLEDMEAHKDDVLLEIASRYIGLYNYKW